MRKFRITYREITEVSVVIEVEDGMDAVRAAWIENSPFGRISNPDLEWDVLPPRLDSTFDIELLPEDYL